MSNRFSSKESNRIKSETDFTKDAVLQYDLQNNPTLVRRIRVNIFQSDDINKWTDGQPFKILFPFKSVYVENTPIGDYYIEARVNSEDNNNDYVKLRVNDSLTFDRKITSLFLKTDGYVPDTNNSTVLDNGYVDLVFFTDASFESGKKLNDFSEPLNGNNIRWPWEPYTLLLPAGPFATQGHPQAASTSVPLCFANPNRKCINLYISKDCLLITTNENGEYDTTDIRYDYLPAGRHQISNGSVLTLETLSDNTVIYCSEEY